MTVEAPAGLGGSAPRHAAEPAQQEQAAGQGLAFNQSTEGAVPPEAAGGDFGPDRPFHPRTVTAEAVFILLGSMAASFGLTWLVYERILPLSGGLGFWLVFTALVFVLYGVGVLIAKGRRAVSDHLVGLFAFGIGLLILAVVLDQIGYVIFRGSSALGHSNFFTQTMARTGPLDPLSSGGVLHAMVGSVEQVGIATLFAVPLGVLAALFLVEIGGPMAQPVRALVTAMTSLPEIIAGLFIYALFILTFGLRQTGFAAGLALTVMMIPYVARASEVMLRLVPNSLREASYALGSSQWRTVWNVVLPTARSGLTTAVVLGIARAVGETAPVLLTSGFSSYMNTNPFSGWQTSLPLFIYESVKEPQASMIQRAFGAALVLMFLILVLFTIARVLGGAAPGEVTRRQRRRMTRDMNREPGAGPSRRSRRVRAQAQPSAAMTAGGSAHHSGPDGFEEATHATA